MAKLQKTAEETIWSRKYRQTVVQLDSISELQHLKHLILTFEYSHGEASARLQDKMLYLHE
jgi:hypothetical protein